LFFGVDAAPGVCDDSANLLPNVVARGAKEKAIGLRVTILASGSSGNMTLLESENTRLLIDAGLGKRETLARLAAVGKDIDHLDGILISHEHNDHCSGLPQALALWKAPLYVTETTMDALHHALPATFGKRLRGVETIDGGERFTIGDIDVESFDVPHDAKDPLCFTFCADGVKLALVTDLGCMPNHVRHHLRGCDCVVLESNHEPDMLKAGPYPWVVKQRVMGKHGHLSNQTVSEFLADPDAITGFDAKARYLVLAHLSQENNNPHTARISAEEALNRRPPESAFSGQLLVASQEVPLAPIQL
jgi:phosphoribosyl 1,2-cyclic phosphodiesterase